MLKNPCVSVIVPFYNAKSYIKTCLEVLLNQDFSKSFEVEAKAAYWVGITILGGSRNRKSQGDGSEEKDW